MEVKLLQKRQTNNVFSQEKKDELHKKARKDHDKLIKGMFEFVDAQGGWLDFTYRIFKDDPIATYRLVHGEICELPLGVVKHLRNCRKKIRKFAQDLTVVKNGVPSTCETVSRISFTPVDI